MNAIEVFDAIIKALLFGLSCSTWWMVLQIYIKIGG